VLEEESDRGPPRPDWQSFYTNRFELYVQAMVEIGADPVPATRFANLDVSQGRVPRGCELAKPRCRLKRR
jgi:hypothetical protein